MLDAENPGTPATEPPEDPDSDRYRRSLIPRTLRSLHCEVPRTGRRSSQLRSPGGSRYSRQRAHDDAGKEQRGYRGDDRALALESSVESIVGAVYDGAYSLTLRKDARS